MTWYEWGMYSMKVIQNHQRQLLEWDLKKVLTGEFMALFANANSNNKGFKREDFFPISTDIVSEPVEELPLSFKDAKALLGSKIKKE